ncbi:MAG TPA: TraR/DksA C4-type zinc finger protein [Ornithinibacter sp.]|nr:TraR/DksA C4-type zinc finger protein [Ornithinibacter sp.]
MSDDPDVAEAEVAAGRVDLPAWAAARLAEERALLLARITQMDGDMESLVAASRDSNADDEHDPEGQTIAYERSQLGALTDRVRDHLAELQAATDRLAAGTYGVCEVCGGSIDPARLEARPTAATCVEHAGPGRRRP